MRKILLATVTACALGSQAARGGVYTRTYGDMDLVGFGFPVGVDPTAGAIVAGLAAGAASFSSVIQPHTFPFSPSAGDFPGTDQIYVGSAQTTSLDGYSGSGLRLPGPQMLTLDLTALVPAGETPDTLTIGLGADDFQAKVLGQPFTASINGTVNLTLSALLNSLDQTTPVEQYFSLGLDPSLASAGTLTLTIDEGGNGGDGWSLDYVTLGVTTAVPEPSVALVGTGLASIAIQRRSRRLR